jgi:hypothetical protein
MNFVGAAEGFLTHFRQPQVLDFPLFHEFRHCANGIFDWYFLIRPEISSAEGTVSPVEVVKIDLVNVQTFQTIRAGLFDVFRVRTDPETTVQGVTELRGKENVLSSTCFFEPLANKVLPLITIKYFLITFVMSSSVDIRSVPKGHSSISGSCEKFQIVILRIRWSIRERESHGTEAD